MISGTHDIQRGGNFFNTWVRLSHLIQFLDDREDEECGQQTDDTIQPIGEPMSEVIPFLQVHIKHRYKRTGDNEVANPLCCNSDGNCFTSDGIWEYLGNEHPANGAP